MSQDAHNHTDGYVPGTLALQHNIEANRVHAKSAYIEDRLQVKVIDMPGRKELYEPFDQLPQINGSIAIGVNHHFEVQGTNAGDADVTFAANVAGIQMQTDGAQDDQVIILPHLDTPQTAWTSIPWGTENEVHWECRIRTDTAITNMIIWAGLKLTNTSAIDTDNDQVFFRYSTDDSNTTWRAIDSINNNDINTDSGVTVQASTVYKLRIEIDASRIARFYINNKLVRTTTALTNGTDLIPYVGVEDRSADGTAATIFLIDEKISRLIHESS